jgi:carboxylesterase type B
MERGFLLMAITETKTKYGQIHGVQKDGYTVFRGVPYAKPPVGEKRFCPPEEPACWEGVYKVVEENRFIDKISSRKNKF